MCCQSCQKKSLFWAFHITGDNLTSNLIFFSSSFQNPIWLWTRRQICIFKNVHNVSSTRRLTSISHLFVCDCAASCHHFTHAQQISNVLTTFIHTHLCGTVSHSKHMSNLRSVVFLPLGEGSVSCHVSVLPVSAVKPPDRVINPELDDSYLTDLTETHTHKRIVAIHLGSFTLNPPQSSICGKLLGATYISVKQKPSGLDHLTLPKIHCHFALLDRFFSAFCTGHRKIKPYLTSCDTGSWCQVISKKVDAVSDLVSENVFLTLLACPIMHIIRNILNELSFSVLLSLN